MFTLPLEEQVMLSTLLTQPHRKYHNINHVNGCLAEAYKFLNTNDAYTQYQKALIHAIWYHDVIYNPYAPAGINEEQSAQLYLDYNKDRCHPYENNTVASAIRATSKHIVTQDMLDAKSEYMRNVALFMLDIDLAGFGKDRMIFAQNGMNIRHEYYNTKIKDFLVGRLNFYKALTKRSTLYYTEYFKDLYHTKSQENIKWEVSVLEDAIEQDDVSIWRHEMEEAMAGYY